MKLLRTSLVLVLLLIIIAAAWLWFNRPSPVDLATYAPADSLLYIELNNPSAVARAIQDTDVWKAAAPITHSQIGSESKLAMAAAVIQKQPAALQLRYLQTLVEIGSEKNSTIVFPLPLDILSSLGRALDRFADGPPAPAG